MYQELLSAHSFTRWLVLVALLFAIYRAGKGFWQKKPFTKRDNTVRHWTATIAQIQLLIGMLLYFKSPIIHYFHTHFREAVDSLDTTFFGLIHPLLMLSAIVVLSIGSSFTKRRTTDSDKFRTMLIWYGGALLIILLAIPWPFSPLASRPLIR